MLINVLAIRPSLLSFSFSSSSSSSPIISLPLDARKSILTCLYDGYEIESPKVSESDVLHASGYARTDSTGYRNIMKDLKESQLVEKKGKQLWLTEKGIKTMDDMAAAGGLVRKPKKTNADFEALYKEKIIKYGKGKIPVQKLDQFWECLRDRRAHSVKELLKATGYERPDSTGYKFIMKAVKEFGLIEKVGNQYKFVEEKVFPVKE